MLSKRDQEIVKLYFGFYNDKSYTQYEIAFLFHMDQSQISRIIKKSLKILKEQLQNQEEMESIGKPKIMK